MRRTRLSPATRNFARHYAEMLAAMFAGMFVLGAAQAVVFSAAGTGWNQLTGSAPTAVLLVMAVNMTVPMVGWMIYRGHGRQANAEMAASMFVPTFGAIALLGAGILDNGHAAMGVQHVVMFPAMLVAMLLRRDEYSGVDGHHGRSSAAPAQTGPR